MPDKPINKLEENERFEISDVEIFAVGEWNGDKYTESDLDEMVRAFDEVGEQTKPFLKIGHSDKQKLLAEDELPSAGLVKNLRRIGKKLIADFVQVPKKVAQAIRNKSFNRVSSEIFWNISVLGNKFKRMLKAVSILGGEMPAVVTLDDINKLSAAHGAAEVYKSDAEIKVCEIDISKKQEETKMKEEEMKEKLAEMERQLTDKDSKIAELEAKANIKDDDDKDEFPRMKKRLKQLEEENAQLKKKLEQLTKKNEEMTAEVKKHEWEVREAQVEKEVDGYIQAEKINPSQKDALKTFLLQNQEKAYKLGEKECTVSELFKVFIDGGKPDLNTKEGSEVGKPDVNDIADKAQKYAEEHKISYKEALIKISPEDNTKTV